jgi:hypothetical protein
MQRAPFVLKAVIDEISTIGRIGSEAAIAPNYEGFCKICAQCCEPSFCADRWPAKSGSLKK